LKILMFGGFLGSGKTTIIKQLIHSIVRTGKQIAVIENEIGKAGIDQDIISETGVSVTEMFGGCVCCQITGSLFEGIRKIHKDLAPDWLIVECTGFALMTDILDAFHQYGDPDVPYYSISVLDNSRFEILMKAMENVIKAQLKGVDIVLINKIDILPLDPDREKQIREFSDKAEIIPIIASKAEPDEIWNNLSPFFKK
jgi:G3E family GTPase